MSAPQWSYSFGGVNGSNLGGGSAQNSTSNVPGSGYGYVILSENMFQHIDFD